MITGPGPRKNSNVSRQYRFTIDKFQYSDNTVKVLGKHISINQETVKCKPYWKQGSLRYALVYDAKKFRGHVMVQLRDQNKYNIPRGIFQGKLLEGIGEDRAIQSSHSNVLSVLVPINGPDDSRLKKVASRVIDNVTVYSMDQKVLNGEKLYLVQYNSSHVLAEGSMIPEGFEGKFFIWDARGETNKSEQTIKLTANPYDEPAKIIEIRDMSQLESLKAKPLSVGEVDGIERYTIGYEVKWMNPF